MDYELELTKAHRLQVSRAFRFNKRVDFAIDCVVEGQQGKVFVDNLAQPSAYRLTVGPFWYFAGDARSAGGQQLMQPFPAYHILMPSPPAWVDLARELYGEHLKTFSRYSLSAAHLSADHLRQLRDGTSPPYRFLPLSLDVAQQVAEQADSYLDLSDFDSVADFVERGLGYVALDQAKVIGIAYSSLVCSQGIEVSLYVDEAYRRHGVATALGSQLLLACVQQGRRPNWDAANPESVKLAEKLGYVYLETYEAYYHTQK
jgi:GNAT superfamily N-acetyltransferase